MAAESSTTSSSAAAARRRLIVLGSSGSIGVNTLAVVEHLRQSEQMAFEVVGLATGSRGEVLREQAQRFGVRHVAVADPAQALACFAGSGIEVFSGEDAARLLVERVAQPGDLVVGAMVGAAGIPATLEAIDRGCDIALANKETLVAAGELVMPRVRQRGVNLLPIDSEHSAIFQCLEASRDPHDTSAEVRRIVLTASGGPFRTWPRERVARATVADALNHPTWSMGPKVTIDSASLMNKALEVIEAHWLFGVPADRIDVIIHPQSIVHGLVEFADGSVVAQLSAPDMRLPIQYALTWPRRCHGGAKALEWAALRKLEFEPVDESRFAAPALARRAIEMGGTAGAVLNAANEAAVQAFLAGHINFLQIVEAVQEAFEAIEPTPVHTMDDVLSADRAARAFVHERLAAASSR